MSKVYIKVFAVLKEHLEEEFSIPNAVSNIEELKTELVNINPAVKNLLESCRFAVNNTFIDNSFQLKENDTIYIVPPSSGG